MNFYKHHLGDYDGATAHLSWDEDMAYTRMMRVYYRRELPLPPARADIYRLVRASGKSQRAGVDAVLVEFFEEQDDGWHNKRCDEEIAAYQAQASTNRRIAQQRTVQRIVNEPPDESSNEPSTNGSPVYRSTRGPNHKPEPRTKNQEPEESKSKTKTKPKINGYAAKAAFVLPDWIPKTQWDAWIEARKKKRNPPTDFAMRLAISKLENLLDDGHNPAAVLAQSAFNGWAGLFEVKP